MRGEEGEMDDCEAYWKQHHGMPPTDGCWCRPGDLDSFASWVWVRGAWRELTSDEFQAMCNYATATSANRLYHEGCREWAVEWFDSQGESVLVPPTKKVEPVPQTVGFYGPTGYAALDAKAQEVVNTAVDQALTMVAMGGKPVPKPPEVRRCRWAAGMRLAVYGFCGLEITVDHERADHANGCASELTRWTQGIRSEYARKTKEWPRCEEGGTVEVSWRPCIEQLGYEAVLICDRCSKA